MPVLGVVMHFIRHICYLFNELLLVLPANHMISLVNITIF